MMSTNSVYKGCNEHFLNTTFNDDIYLYIRRDDMDVFALCQICRTQQLWYINTLNSDIRYGTRTILNFIRLFHPPTYSHIKLMIIAKNIPKRNEFILYLDDDDCPNNEGV